MAAARTRLHRIMWLAIGAMLAALGAFFVLTGLNDADKYASVIGAMGTMVGLGLSLSALVRQPSLAALPPDESRPTPGQQVQASTIGGDAVQVRRVGGSVRVSRSLTPAPQTRSPQPPGGVAPPGASPSVQSLTNVQISGSSTQIDEIAGDVDIERET